MMTADKSREVLSNRTIFVKHKCWSVLARASGFALVSLHIIQWHRVSSAQHTRSETIRMSFNTREVVTAFCSFFSM